MNGEYERDRWGVLDSERTERGGARVAARREKREASPLPRVERRRKGERKGRREIKWRGML